MGKALAVYGSEALACQPVFVITLIVPRLVALLIRQSLYRYF